MHLVPVVGYSLPNSFLRSGVMDGHLLFNVNPRVCEKEIE